MGDKIPLEHPGIILKEEFMEELDLTAYAVSKATGIPQTALGEILKGKRSISPVNALKLAKFFNLSENYFLNIQARFDLDKAKEKAEKTLAQIIPYKQTKLDYQEWLEA